DNCTGAVTTQTSGLASGSVFPIGVTTNTFQVTDAAGLTVSCSFTVTVTDAEAPAITCPANVVTVTNTGCTATGVALGTPVTSDNCSVASVFNNAPAFFPLGITTVTWTVTDGSDNTSTCIQLVTVNDNVPPAITCPANISRSNDVNNCSAFVNVPNPTMSDNCGPITKLTWTLTGATTANSPVTGINYVGTRTFNVGVTTITYIANDLANNSATCSFLVTIIDTQPPVINCPANITKSNDVNNCSAFVNVPNPTMSDNCGSITKLTWAMTGATTSSSPANGINYIGTYAFNVGTTTVTYIATDASGNTKSCSFTVKVNDVQAPVISCPVGSPFSRGTFSGGCFYIVQGSEFNPASFSDNCPGTTIHNSFNNTNTLANAHLPVGVNVITWTATDVTGLIKTCNITINVLDDDPPVIVCPPNITVPCPDNIPEPNIGLVTATDNCGTVTIMHVSDNYLGLGNKPGFCPTGVERTYSATDAAGNSVTCMQMITVAGQCGCVICQSSVPHFYVNMNGGCDSVWTSPSMQRIGKCCSAGGSDRCISFSVKIDPHAIGFYFLIDGATPAGHYVQVDCGPIMPMSSLICSPPDGEYHTVTFCKPGGNANIYTIHSVCGMEFPETIFTREDCGQTVTISGIVESTVTWTDVTGGGIYNRYLSCDYACLNPVITPDSLAPPVIKYLVCGQVAGNPCSSGGIVCDTVVVHVYPKISISISPDPPTFCDYSPGTIYAAIFPANMYLTQWWDGPNGTGSVVSTSDNYTPPAPGLYSITVTDIVSDLPCQNDTLNFEVALKNCVPLCPMQYHCDTSEIVTYTTVSGFIAAGGQIDFPCTVPDQNIILTNEESEKSGCPEIFNRSYQIWDSCGNVDICQEIITIDDTVPPQINSHDSVHWCVQDIVQAIWDRAGDFTPPRPDWYTFNAGNTSLDLDPSTFSDNCTLPANLILHWEITLNGGTVITGIDQISAYPTIIQFPLGNNTIIYWLEDQCGNLTPPQSRLVVTVIVHARPTIIENF
ncbi:MAG: HYR domain-containing protein, partial [Bacteroidota bacterium]